MKKLNKNQQNKLSQIQNYLMTEIGSAGMTLSDNDVTYISSLKRMYIDATGIVLKGYDYTRGVVKARIFPEEITSIYRAGIKGDEDFMYFINQLNDSTK